MSYIKFLVAFLLLFTGCGSNLFAYDFTNFAIEQVIYISSSLGDDSNPGTQIAPKKTIGSVKNKKNVEILLKRGDVFFETVSGLRGCKVGAYGYGEKPVVCGFRILKNANAWTKVSDRIWCIDLCLINDFEGFPIVPSEFNKQGGNIGMIYDINNDKIYGNLVKEITSLKKDGDFFVSEKWLTKDFDNKGIIYAFFDQDPRLNKGWCFSMGENGFYSLTNCWLSDLSIVGFGKHGLLSADDTFVERCDFDLIGGSILIGFNYWVRYGNGIELKHNNSNVVVKDCQISRVYDAATTIQSSGKGLHSPNNIHFINNRIVYCRQAFERYLTSSDNDPQYIDCEFSNNVCVFSGDNKFGITKYGNECHLLSYEKTTKPIIIQNNIFFGSNYLCCYTFSEGMKDNIVYIYPDQYLNHYHGIKDYQTILSNDFDAIYYYRQRAFDSSKIIVIARHSKQDNKIKSLIIKQLNYKAPINSLKRIIAFFDI